MPAPKEKAQPKPPSATVNAPTNAPQSTRETVSQAQNSIGQPAPLTSSSSPATSAGYATAPRTPNREEIELAAYTLYLERGALDGYAEEDWLQAERELIEGREAQRKARAKSA